MEAGLPEEQHGGSRPQQGQDSHRAHRASSFSAMALGLLIFPPSHSLKFHHNPHKLSLKLKKRKRKKPQYVTGVVHFNCQLDTTQNHLGRDAQCMD